MTEEEFLHYLRTHAGRGGLASGIGDDCAVVQERAGAFLLTTDALVEGVHFELAYFPPRYLGRKLASVNLSDLAAMGGVPRYALLTLGLPSPPQRPWVEEFLHGLTERLQDYGAALVGGDTVRNPGGLFLNLALLGRAVNRPLRRDGAAPGDTIYVSRPLGGAAAGLELLQRGKTDPQSLIWDHLDPQPEIVLGQALAREAIPSAAMDISDGLARDLFRLCEASGVGALLLVESLPFSPDLKTTPLRRDPLWYVLYGGEDFALLFTVPEEKESALKALCGSLGRQVWPIGKVLSKKEFILEEKGGSQRSLLPGGFDHFA